MLKFRVRHHTAGGHVHVRVWAVRCDVDEDGEVGERAGALLGTLRLTPDEWPALSDVLRAGAEQFDGEVVQVEILGEDGSGGEGDPNPGGWGYGEDRHGG